MNKVRSHFFGLLILLMSLLIYSCSIFGGDDPEIVPGVEGTYTGIYSQGFEDSDFNPCIDRDESWQLSSEDPAAFSKINEAEGNPVYVKLRGIPSEKGEFMGFYVMFDRKFEVKEVLFSKSLNEKNCL
ncbi:MAG: hypothetical protein JXR26_12125 [Balneolaceae bacterium]|nr:hypothetical protein [Balneolaceae bacterium]